MMGHFVGADRDADFLLPPSVHEWLPEDHLARFVVEVVDRLDLSELTRHYAGRGSRAHHPAVLLSLLIYGYATGVFSRHNIERATHDALAAFRRLFLPQIESLFVQVLLLARENRFASDDPAPVMDDPVAQMKHRLASQSGRALYALRKQTVEPVFGMIKQVMGPEAVLDEGSGEGCGRMDVGCAGVECETDEGVENDAVSACCPR